MATIFCRALWISFGLIAGAVPSLAQQQVPVSPDQPARVYDYVFPVEFEGAKRLSVRGYDDPGLGYSVGYQRGDVADVPQHFVSQLSTSPSHRIPAA